MKKPSLCALPLTSVLFLACSSDGSCPVGSVRLGGECVADEARADAAIPSEDAASAGGCGDGTRAGSEACDDGNRADGDGCSSKCALEDACADNACAPAAPTVRGAPSMAPGRVLWAWSVPEGASRVELRLDGEPVPTSEAARLSPDLAEGHHTLEARACSEAGCSDWVAHNTVVEGFGQTLPPGLVDTARKLTRTSLGHPVAIGCERCLSDADGAPLSPSATALALERAVDRKSDLLVFAVASVDGALRVTARDVAKPDGLTALSDVLAQPALADGDAPLMLDLVENEPRLTGAVTPKVLAEALRAVLEAAPLVARNGRPLLVRTTYGNRGYLSAVRDALADAPELAPYVRYVLRDPEGPIADFYALDALSLDAPLVPSLEFVDAVSFGYAAPDLPNRITLSRRAGRAVIIEGVPGSGAQHGHALISALRDQADVLITRYRADRAQALVALDSRALHFDAANLRAQGSSVELWYDSAQGAVSVDAPLEGAGAPVAEVAEPSGALAPALMFGESGTDGSLTVPAGDSSSTAGNGFLSTAFGGFGGPFASTDGRGYGSLAPHPYESFQIGVYNAQGFRGDFFTAGEIVAACGLSLARLFSETSTHWFVVYRDVNWALVIDGVCSVTKAATEELRVDVPKGTYQAFFARDNAITTASILRLPAGYDSDTAF